MSVLSAPLKDDIEMQKDIFRLAATLFSEDNSVYSATESKLQMIKCIFIRNDNLFLTVREIAQELFSVYKFHVSKDEIVSSINKYKKQFLVQEIDGEMNYRLIDTIYNDTIKKQQNSIEHYISQYIEYAEVTDTEKCEYAIYKYLYELTTTNINSYRILIYGKDSSRFSDSELSVDISYLSDEEINYVHDFIDWENSEKNIALSNIVFTCLEYCMLVNGDKPNRLLVDSIRRREIYLDTNILFRAIGINGSARKKVVISFLKKCKQARLKLIISHNTKKEFMDTIDYYINKINEFPRGKVSKDVYEMYSDYNIFSFFNDWGEGRVHLSTKFFRFHILSLYAQLVQDYSILDDETIPKEIYNSEELKQKRDNYSIAINEKKQELKPSYVSDEYYYYSSSRMDKHDASVISYVEYLREKNDQNKDIFFVSSDKILRYWDMDRKNSKYPIVIYPSQLFLILIKTCGRSENDFDSFVSFINVKTPRRQINAEKIDVILSAISSITEDIETQKILVSAVVEGEYQDITKNSIADESFYNRVQEITKNYLDKVVEKKNEEISSLKTDATNKNNRINDLEKDSFEKQNRIDILEHESKEKNETIEKQEKIIEANKQNEDKHKEQICLFAEKKIMPKYVFVSYVLPILGLLLMLFIIVFILFQFVFKDVDWNFAINAFEWIKNTWFGTKVQDLVYVIDFVLFCVSSFLHKKTIKNMTDKMKKCEYKEKLINDYVEKNHLYEEKQ